LAFNPSFTFTCNYSLDRVDLFPEKELAPGEEALGLINSPTTPNPVFRK
jgi:hypothetical protein